MKYHKKARQFCKDVIFKDEDAKTRLQDIVKNTIVSADSRNASLKELMQEFGVNFGSKEPKEAIGILEVLFESLGTRDIQFYIDQSENFGMEWRMSSRHKLFDEVLSSMYETAKQHHNEDLLKHLDSYTELITYHDKATPLYEKMDPEGEYCDSVMQSIHRAINKYPLRRLMKRLGSFVPAYDSAEIGICVLEAIYEALNEEKDFIVLHQFNKGCNKCTLDSPNAGNIFNIDALFSEAFYSAYEEAYYRDDQDVLNALEEYYPPGPSQIDQSSLG